MNALGIKILIGVALLAGAIFAWNGYTSSLIERGDKAGYSRAVGEYRDRELEAVKAAREEEHRKTADVQKEADRAKNELAALRGSYAGAVDAGQRLRRQLAAARPGCTVTAQPAPAGASAPADPAADLYADVQRRLEEAENGTIRFADESHVAGRTCERSYQAVTPP